MFTGVYGSNDAPDRRLMWDVLPKYQPKRGGDLG